MNITIENIDKVNAVITAVMEPADYTEKYNKALKDVKKRINLPGFRPGMAPIGLLKKQYGLSILAEEVNKILQDNLFAFISNNKINMLGTPLASEDNNIELKEGETFTFKFDIALAPEFDVELSKSDTINYYNIEVTDEMVDSHINSYRQQGGKYEDVDSYEDNDMVKGTLVELNTETPLTVEGATLLPKYFHSDDQKALFADVKVNDIITINPSVAYDNNEIELASLLNIDKSEVANYKNDFTFQIETITRHVPAEMDQELFGNVFPEEDITDEATFRARVKETIADQFKADSDYKFLLDARTYITEKVGTLEFPDEKLRRILLDQYNNDQAKVDEKYTKSIEELTWHLIKEKIVEQNGIKISDDDIKNAAKDIVKMQYAQYGMTNIPDVYLEKAATEMMKKDDTRENLLNRSIDVKLTAVLKEQVTLAESTVTMEDFNKMF